jgi:hypothetical protein
VEKVIIDFWRCLRIGQAPDKHFALIRPRHIFQKVMNAMGNKSRHNSFHSEKPNLTFVST